MQANDNNGTSGVPEDVMQNLFYLAIAVRSCIPVFHYVVFIPYLRETLMKIKHQ